jgi:DNA (cytosine-5)-methyltransferase 1
LLTYGSLFSGCGGLDLGLDWSGFTCKWQCEIDEFANRILEKNWPSVTRYRDIKKIDTKELERVDLIAGGFPCQDISNAGTGDGLDGERSGLFFEVVRIVRSLRPRYLLLENVSALLVRGLDRVLGSLAEIGYNAEWHCVSAAHFGAPHIRDRIFILAYPHRSQCSGSRLPSGVHEEQPHIISGGSCRYASPAVGKNVADSASERQSGPGEPFLKMCTEAQSNWQAIVTEPSSINEVWKVEPGMGRVVDGVSNRVHSSGRLKCLGNAVVPQIGEFFGNQILSFHRAIEDEAKTKKKGEINGTTTKANLCEDC